MQILRDTATLAIVVLLALTVRIESDGTPIELDLGTPAEAASLQTPELVSPVHGAIEWEIDSVHDLTAATVDLTRLVQLASQKSRCAIERTHRTITIQYHRGSVPQILRELRLTPHAGGREIEMTPEAPDDTPDARPCEASLDPALSC